MNTLLERYRREASAAAALLLLLLLLALAAPQFYTASNLRDLVLNNTPALVAAIGMTLVILVGQIDISIGAQFAICSVAAGVLAKLGVPMIAVAAMSAAAGAVLGALNGALIGGLGVPSIVVTLAAMVGLRDGLRWITQGAWVQDLPPGFQWAGLGQASGQVLIIGSALVILVAFAWGLGNLSGGREVYATGSDAEAARLMGIRPRRVTFLVFVMMGILAGVAATLNAIRFSEVQSNAGAGLEMKAIAAVVVGGASITGGRGTLAGTLVGVALLGAIGTSLTFLGINPFWEKAIQGGIILSAVVWDALRKPAGHARAY